MKDKLCTFKFSGTSSTGKTKIWLVMEPDSLYQLGFIKWFGRWRCYAFYPDDLTIYEQKCLRHIANFCENQSTEARQSWSRKKK